MTGFERKQPQLAFINAGKGAFLIDVPFQNNPYRDQPQRGLWDKGFRAARRKFDRNRRAEVLIGGVPVR